MTKEFFGKVTGLSLYADGKHRVNFDGKDGYMQLVVQPSEVEQFKLGVIYRVITTLEFSEETKSV